MSPEEHYREAKRQLDWARGIPAGELGSDDENVELAWRAAA